MIDLPPLTLRAIAVGHEKPGGFSFVDPTLERLAIATKADRKSLSDELGRQEQLFRLMPHMATRAGCNVASIYGHIAVALDLERQSLAYRKAAACVQRAARYLQEDPGGKVVLFTSTGPLVHDLIAAMRPYRPLRLTASCDTDQREYVSNRFHRDETSRVVIAALDGLDYRVDLTAAPEAIIVDASPDPYVTAQAICRVHMHGQRRPVRIRFAAMAQSPDLILQRAMVRAVRPLVSDWRQPF